jgi:hypothetical protein
MAQRASRPSGEVASYAAGTPKVRIFNTFAMSAAPTINEFPFVHSHCQSNPEKSHIGALICCDGIEESEGDAVDAQPE